MISPRTSRWWRRLRFVLLVGCALFASLVLPVPNAEAGTNTDKSGAASLIAQLFEQNPRLAQAYRERRLASDEQKRSKDTSPPFLAVRALEGLSEVLAGHVDAAKEVAKRLMKQRWDVGDSVFFADERSPPTAAQAAPSGPPHSSVLLQGAALALFDQLARRTSEATFQEMSMRIARSYAVPVADGGFASRHGDTVAFQRRSDGAPTVVLNEAAIATLALIDFARRTGDSASQRIVESAGRWWHRDIGLFDVMSPDFPGPVPAYSLGGESIDLLLRFVGPGSVDVSRIDLVRAGTTLRTLRVGGPDDADRSADQFVWSDPSYMNWGPRAAAGAAAYRSLVPHQGTFDHAPITFRILASEAAVPLEVHVSARRHGPGLVAVEVYDDARYHRIGEIPADAAFATPAIFKIPSVVFDALKMRVSSPPLIVEAANFREDVSLTALLADAFNDDGIRHFERRWRSASVWTPSRFDTQPRMKLLHAPGKQPLLSIVPGGEESIHVEYPSVVELGGILHLFYGAFGTDKRWRIKVATSTDGGATWKREGSVLDERTLPFNGSYAFPHVVFDRARERYLLYFTVIEHGGSDYDSIWVAESASLRQWRLLGPVVPEGGLDPLIWIEGGLFYMNYTLSEGGASWYGADKRVSSTIVERVSADGVHWSSGRSIYNRRFPNRAFYTMGRLETARGALWVLNTLASGSREWRLLCRGHNGFLIDAWPRAVLVSKSGPGPWDSYRYGVNFFAHAGVTWAFYNGIQRLLNGDGNGQIGRAIVDMEAVDKLALNPDCRLSRSAAGRSR